MASEVLEARGVEAGMKADAWAANKKAREAAIFMVDRDVGCLVDWLAGGETQK